MVFPFTSKNLTEYQVFSVNRILTKLLVVIKNTIMLFSEINSVKVDDDQLEFRLYKHEIWLYSMCDCESKRRLTFQ
jgi:hypothetical protein